MRAERHRKQISFEAETLLTEGKVSEAVRVVREGEGLSGREARKRIDAYIATEPVLGVQLEAQRRDSRRKSFQVLLLVVALIGATVIYALHFAPH